MKNIRKSVYLGTVLNLKLKFLTPIFFILGKTTLAQVVARHAGYNIIEINASDERSIEKFETVIKNSTQMQSVLDRDNRPNCLIFDEIDGAPQASIDYLVKVRIYIVYDFYIQ